MLIKDGRKLKGIERRANRHSCIMKYVEKHGHASTIDLNFKMYLSYNYIQPQYASRYLAELYKCNMLIRSKIELKDGIINSPNWVYVYEEKKLD